MVEMNRRQFVTTIAAVGAACALCTMGGGAPALAAESTDTLIDAGEAKSLAQGPTETFTLSDHFIIVRKNDVFYVTSSVCTHRRADVAFDHGQFVCPSHGSKFDVTGKLLKGPAKTSLPRYGVSIKNGHLMVDKSKKFLEAQWDAPDASVKLPS